MGRAWGVSAEGCGAFDGAVPATRRWSPHRPARPLERTRLQPDELPALGQRFCGGVVPGGTRLGALRMHGVCCTCGMTNGAQRMHQLSINLPPELFEFVQKAAERETRPVSMQIRHYIAEAVRRAGNPASSLEPWPRPSARLRARVSPRRFLQPGALAAGVGPRLGHARYAL